MNRCRKISSQATMRSALLLFPSSLQLDFEPESRNQKAEKLLGWFYAGWLDLEDLPVIQLQASV